MLCFFVPAMMIACAVRFDTTARPRAVGPVRELQPQNLKRATVEQPRCRSRCGRDRRLSTREEPLSATASLWLATAAAQ